jgi:hypothetical protein
MNCTNKATKFQILDDPSCSITGDGRDWYCQKCYSDCVGDEEEETNDYMKELITCFRCEQKIQRKDLYSCTNVCKECQEFIDNEPEEEKECDGKYCENTENLKEALGWNRWFIPSRLDIHPFIKKFMFCPDCIDDCSVDNCKGCETKFPYELLTVVSKFGEYCDLYCKECLSKKE